jgi:hypothetical protein
MGEGMIGSGFGMRRKACKHYKLSKRKLVEIEVRLRDRPDLASLELMTTGPPRAA